MKITLTFDVQHPKAGEILELAKDIHTEVTAHQPAPATAAPATATPAPAPAAMSQAEFAEAVQAYARASSPKAAKAKLAELGFNKTADVPPERYAEVAASLAV